MKFKKIIIFKSVIIGLIFVFLALTAFLVLKNKNQTWTGGKILSRTDYRIFACGEEIFLKPDPELLKVKRNGLFAKSSQGSIMADGTPLRTDDLLLSSFFEATGGALDYSDEQKSIFLIPTEAGVREFYSGDLCNGKEANLYVLHHRVEIGTEPWSIYSRIAWKYWDYGFANNYGKVPPGDCYIFLFDSEDVLDRPWPRCKSHENALATGELVLEK